MLKHTRAHTHRHFPPVCSLAAFLLGSLWYLGSDKSASHCRLPRWLLCCSCSQRAWIASNIYGKPPRLQPTPESSFLPMEKQNVRGRGWWEDGHSGTSVDLSHGTSFYLPFQVVCLEGVPFSSRLLLLFPLGVSVTQGYLGRPVICCLFQCWVRWGVGLGLGGGAPRVSMCSSTVSFYACESDAACLLL